MITFTSYSVKEQDPPVYYSIVILTILYYLRVAGLMGITGLRSASVRAKHRSTGPVAPIST